MESFREKLLVYGSLFTLFILPLLYFSGILSPYVTSKTFIFYGLVEVLFSFWVYSLFVDRSYRLSRSQLITFIPVFLYLVWLSVAGFLAVDPVLSFWSSLGRGTGLLTLYHSFALSLIITSLIKRGGKDYLYRLVGWLMASSFVLALSVWFGDEGFKLFLNDSKGGGLIGNSSMTAAYLLFIVVLGLFVILSKDIKSGRKWWTSIVLFLIIFSPLFINIYGLFKGTGLLGSARGATLGLLVIVGVAFLGWLVLSKNKILKYLGIFGIFISLLLFSIGWSQLIKPGTYLNTKFAQVASGTRFIFWDVAQKGLDKHPYFGYGVENYNATFQDFFNPIILDSKYAYEGWPDHAHNIYYDTGVSGGYPAIALYGIFILSILYSIYKAYKSGSLSRMQASIFGGLIIGYIFQDLFVFDSMLSIMILFAFMGIIFGLENSKILQIPLSQEPFLQKKKKKNRNSQNSQEIRKNRSCEIFLRNMGATALLIICIFMLVFFVYLPMGKAVSYNKLISMGIDERPSYYKELLGGSSVGSTIDASSMASTVYAYYAANLPQIKSDVSMRPYVEADLKALTEYLDELILKNNTDFRLYITDVFLYNTLTTLSERPYDKALANYLFSLLEKAHRLSPANPEVYWARANIYAWQGDLKSAENAYKEAVASDREAPGSYRLLINFAKVVKNQKLYEETLKEVQKHIPDFQY